MAAVTAERWAEGRVLLAGTQCLPEGRGTTSRWANCSQGASSTPVRNATGYRVFILPLIPNALGARSDFHKHYSSDCFFFVIPSRARFYSQGRQQRSCRGRLPPDAARRRLRHELRHRRRPPPGAGPNTQSATRHGFVHHLYLAQFSAFIPIGSSSGIVPRLTPPPHPGTPTAPAANLGWKLAAVLHGRAAPSLLASYEAERRPVAVHNVALSLRNQTPVGKWIGIPGSSLQDGGQIPPGHGGSTPAGNPVLIPCTIGTRTEFYRALVCGHRCLSATTGACLMSHAPSASTPPRPIRHPKQQEPTVESPESFRPIVSGYADAHPFAW